MRKPDQEWCLVTEAPQMTELLDKVLVAVIARLNSPHETTKTKVSCIAL
jgi:hypothetical protein